jgi:hypothetical protein
VEAIPFFGVARIRRCGAEMLPLVDRVLRSGSLLQGRR